MTWKWKTNIKYITIIMNSIFYNIFFLVVIIVYKSESI